MTEWIITSSALVLIVMALRGLLKGKISLRLQYGLWALVLVRLLVPFSIVESAMSIGNLAQQIQAQPVIQTADREVRRYESAYDSIVKEYEQMGVTVTPAQVRQEARNQIYDDTYHSIADSYTQEGVEVPEAQLQLEAQQRVESISLGAMISDALPYIWYAGMALVGCALLVSNLYFYWRLRKTRKLLDMPDIPLRVYWTDYVATPCLFGLFQPGIYLTDEVVSDTQMRNHVLAHELTHHRQRDHIWSALRGLCLMLHWYNPLVWAAAALSKQDAELACDEATIRILGEKERLAYGKTLIGMTCVKRDPKSLFLTATTMLGSKKTLKERIGLIAKKPKTAIVTLIACLLVVSIAVGCTFTGANTEPTGDPTEPTTTPATAPSEPTTIPTEPTTEPTEPVTVPTEPSQPLPTVPDTVQALPENYTLDDLVSTYQEDMTWTDELGNEYDTTFSMPLIYPFSEDAIAVQKDIYARMIPLLEENRTYAADHISGVYTWIVFEASLHDNILALITSVNRGYVYTEYTVYYLNLETGKLLTTAEMVKHYLGVSYPEFLMAVCEYRMDEVQAEHPTIDRDFFEWMNVDLADMDNAALFLDQNGTLQLRYGQLSIGGADYYPNVVPFSMDDVDWDAPTKQEAYEWLFSIEITDDYDGYYSEVYATVLTRALCAAPEDFIRYLDASGRTDEVLSVLENHIADHASALMEAVIALEDTTGLSSSSHVIVTKLRSIINTD